VVRALTIWWLKYTVTSIVKDTKYSYNHLPFHPEIPVWPHAFCTKVQKHPKMRIMWWWEEFLRICSQEVYLAEKAQEIQVKILLKKVRRDVTVEPQSSVLFHKSFLGQATRWGCNQWDSADRVFWRSSMVNLADRDEGFLEVKEVETTEQHKSIIRVLRLLERGIWVHEFRCR